MIVTTGMDVSGKEVAEYLGVVRGIVVRATGIGRGIVGGLKSIAGGNIEEFTVVCEEARMEAFNRMVVQMAVLLVIGPIFETDLLPWQYGFRTGLDAKMALRRIHFAYLRHEITALIRHQEVLNELMIPMGALPEKEILNRFEGCNNLSVNPRLFLNLTHRSDFRRFTCFNSPFGETPASGTVGGIQQHL